MAKKKPAEKPYFVRLVVSLIVCMRICLATEESSTMKIPINIGTIVNMDSWVGKVGLSCLNMALSDFYSSHPQYKTRLFLHINDTNTDVVHAAFAALHLIKNVEVQAIIGPQSSMQANFVIDLGDKAKVPVVSFSATSPSLASHRSSYFFQAAQSDSYQAKAISAILEAFGWREAVPIYVDNDFGRELMPSLVDALQQARVRIPYRSAIPPAATDDQIDTELYKLMSMQSRVFILHLSPTSLGSRLFTKAAEIGMMNEGYVWIMTTSLTDLLTSPNASVINSMQGVIGIKTHEPKTEELENFRVRWKRQFLQENPTMVDAQLNVFGLWAYDAAFALAMAVEKVGGKGLGFRKLNASGGLTDLDNIGVSENGPKLSEALSTTRFRGLAGDFSFVNGQLQSSTLQIVNVHGHGIRSVGFWTPNNGLTRKLNSTSTYSTSKSNLGPIIWPGDTTSQPMGYTKYPTTFGKKLRLAVTVKDNISSFVQVVNDSSRNKPEFTGFCIEVFKAVMDAMPYPVIYDFIPFSKPNGKRAGTNNDLIYQVYLGNYDGAVGDITITANRSNYVDFTLPYTDSEVTMIVPTKGKKIKNAWVFLKPLTWDLWVTTGCFLVFIGFVVWVLEHRNNDDFRGPPSHQIGTSFSFALSTTMLVHRERILSNLARFVVLIWCFVVTILTQSYTANLTSLLTVEQLRPSLTDVNELLKNGEKVGHPKYSFVRWMIEGLKFKEENLVEYNSLQHLEQLFANGEISAAFDESPYLRLFVAQHCSNFTLVGPTYKTDGFGFAFPRGSPLIGEISRAILNITEGKKMKEIEDVWFAKNNCSSTEDSFSLGLNSVWGLFLIAGIASLSALVICVCTFLYKHRQILISFDSEASISRKIRVMFKIFDEKDPSSHTFKKTGELQDSRGRSLDGNMHLHDKGMEVIEASQNTNCPPSPSNYSSQSELNFAFPAGEARNGFQN
ncbi:glutamate receptor 2.8 [Ziziphus jujuba]|uniref:Glutamate receptor n=1 Tax=Ziziphus jujuba TaxID=326968 RepID=A0A6P3ZTC4_ZIZJJ|nr:glutamate receptor 2.8 [Ziziphus jujuba]